MIRARENIWYVLFVYLHPLRIPDGWDLSVTRPLLKPCIHDGILAPTRDQRMRYAAWLHVYGKLRKELPERAARLVDSYIVRPQLCLIINNL